MQYVWVALGGALGSMGRYYATVVMVRLTGPQFPWGTILINISGSLVIGLVASMTASGGRFAAPEDARLFLMTGICGGFTTFSSFSLQTMGLLRDGKPAEALANVLLSVVACVLAAMVGYAAGLALAARPLPGRLG
jgi:CrcB protein